MRPLILFLAISLWQPGSEFQTPFEASGGIESATYDQAIAHYQQLAKSFDEVQILEYGKTDVGKPLHLVVLSKDRIFDPERIRQSGRRIMLINNGIHAGEPCGIDASMMLARDLMQKEELAGLLDHVVLAIIPVYNIGGSLNRGCCSRANQVGPKAHGFRGNARNLDLNRDFIKADSRNARAFTRIFQSWRPDVFVDTHTTNGADYPATLTYLATLGDKADPDMAAWTKDRMIPGMKDFMTGKGIKISPYVNVFGDTPDKGFPAFLDLPRYSSGYASLFHTFAFITEAHMLKPFADRVVATYAFLEGLLGHVNENYKEIGKLTAQAREKAKSQETFDVAWQLDRNQHSDLTFEGYEGKTKPSKVTGLNRLYYDREASYTKIIPYYDRYEATRTIEKPKAYIIPQAWQEVIERLDINGVEMQTLSSDMVLTSEVSFVSEVKTSPNSYEGHFYHADVVIRKETREMQFYKGDKVVWVNQERNPYIVHVLEPESQDAFFRWNFFDGILMRKEYFSSYVFEEEAERLLKENPDLNREFQERRSTDSTFAANGYAQLNFIYQNSGYYEKTHNRYPVVRWNDEEPLPVE